MPHFSKPKVECGFFHTTSTSKLILSNKYVSLESQLLEWYQGHVYRDIFLQIPTIWLHQPTGWQRRNFTEYNYGQQRIWTLNPDSQYFCLWHNATRSPCKHMLQHKNSKHSYSCDMMHCDTRPNHLIWTSDCNALQAKICKLARFNV